MNEIPTPVTARRLTPPSPSSYSKWNQFKMLMLLPASIGPTSKKSPTSKSTSVRKQYQDELVLKPPPGRKRSNSAISLIFGGSRPPAGDLSSLQQPYSSLMAPEVAGESTDEDRNSDVTGRRLSLDDRPPSGCNNNSNHPSSPLPPPRLSNAQSSRAIDFRNSSDEVRQLLLIEAGLVEFKNALAALKNHLNQSGYLKSQLDLDANALLAALYRVLSACPEIANASDLHQLASQLIRYASPASPSFSALTEGVAIQHSGGRGVDHHHHHLRSSSSSASASPSPSPPCGVAVVVVVSQSLRCDIARCVDSLAVVLVRRLSRQISASILSDLKEQIIDEEQEPSSRPQSDSFNNNNHHQNNCRTATSRLARSMNDVSSLVGAACEASVAASNDALPASSSNSNNGNNSNPVTFTAAVAATTTTTTAASTTAAAENAPPTVVVVGSPPLLSVPSLAATLGEDLDAIVGKLCRSDGSVEALLEQLRSADRYLKDIASYVEKRTIFYMDYLKSVNKLAGNIKPALSGSSTSTTVPLQYIFLPFVQHDVEYTSLALRSCQAQLSERDGFVSVVTERRNELKRVEKVMQERWSRVVGLYVAAMGDMRKAHQQYERAVDTLSKRRDEECLSKEADAQIQLRTKIMEVNHKLAQLEKTKSECLYEIIRQIGFTETTLKETSEKYFHFISAVICEHPSVYEAMRSQSRCIEVGTQFMAEVRRIISESNHFIFEPIEFEQLRKSVKAQNDSGTSALASSISSMIPLPRAFRVPLTVITSFDSDDESPSRSSSPTATDGPDSVGGEPSNSSAGNSHRRRKARHESLATSHSLSRLRTSSARCHVCRTGVVYEHGVKCDKCGLVFHRKCVDLSSSSCDSRRRSPIFGVDLATHLADTGQQVPIVLQKCISSIERDALSVKGIYRVPGSKRQIEAVCRALEEGSGNSVNLDDEQPHVLTGIVKSYLLQLPEPLFTNKLAQSVLRASREDRLTIEDLQIAVKRLPEANYLTCGLILQHLRVVSHHSDENQMTMSNLAIIFGPTLLLSVLRGQQHQQQQQSSVESTEIWSTSMADTVHASKIVEKLLTNFDIIFDNLPLFLADLRRINGESNNNNAAASSNNNNDPTEASSSPAHRPSPIEEQVVLVAVGGSSKPTSATNMIRQSSNPLMHDVEHQPPAAAATLGSSLTSVSTTSSPTLSAHCSKQGSPGPAVMPPAIELPTIVSFRASTTTQPPPAAAPQQQQQQPQPLDSSLSSPAHLSSSTDTSIQSANERAITTPIAKKMSNVIVRL